MSADTHRPHTPASTVLVEAVNAVMKSFAKHSKNGTVVASDALQEFWDMKLSRTSDAKSPANLLYETEIEILRGKKRYICYVTLPGGSCYGSSSLSYTEKEARESAAKVALMNSVFNEHPSRQISSDLIDKILSSVASDKSASKKNSCLAAFRAMLLTSKGQSLLTFQEIMIIFQLLHWNGNLKEMKRRQCSREEVISRYAGSTMDQKMRDGMVRDWTSRELKLPGVVQSELSIAEEAMRHCREVGTDLRFAKEKREILKRVMSVLAIGPVSPASRSSKMISPYPDACDIVEDDIQVTI